ncbi:serine hydrolase [Mycolicibacterium brumae]|uniref:Beta-lactamase class A catalytic domain-containing protein n=1 Tax=Mycolicibacterium brumae TaxID=85968 RepID=A0A2G5PH15_9MYCO|nr:serine hydrolase [Mycolicibacterium brumae]MCV7194335.1 serine hydrolase [Mycolicibacterium brumae]PIB77264.1 hypothetical protein CQY22_003225 [Mycolicibacterium brumae]RWA15517.1 hypothetical protein MBRU_10730 [Mycolicibacterium brumae DSM 44177]UWW10628.1 class A beta-lactamase-related serine hydrolase [Mycolicibacterium brumae]
MRTLAIIAAALLVGGCSAHAHSAPAAEPTTTADTPALAEPAVAPAGLDARVRQATADASAAGADITTAILDRSSGQFFSSGAGQSFPLASVVKVFIADDLLKESGGTLSAADRQSLDSMLRFSDDSAAQMFWDRNGQSAIISRIVARYGLTGTAAPWQPAKWDVTTSTAGDLVRYYDMLLNGAGGLPVAQANVIINNLAHFAPSGADGYPQRFGIPDGLYREPVAVKQGWFCCWNGANQVHVSTGVIGADRRYVMAISSLQPTDEATARNTITQAVKTMFPGGKA